MDDRLRANPVSCDERVWTPVADGFRRRGWTVRTARDEGTLGDPDCEYLYYATENEWVLATFDDDFFSLVKGRRTPAFGPDLRFWAVREQHSKRVTSGDRWRRLGSPMPDDICRRDQREVVALVRSLAQALGEPPTTETAVVVVALPTFGDVQSTSTALDVGEVPFVHLAGRLRTSPGDEPLGRDVRSQADTCFKICGVTSKSRTAMA
ncbi:DUF5615 family PIN-like protein [Halarchaeum grantii]|uniref:DUF5615 family PIN-like protein n=1 Tax=Halarchaeum grantii TaxID=1193105 RepID=UPI00166A9440|nr:DUF5615 family PIN-like protein [Halarchaeum grantii]